MAANVHIASKALVRVCAPSDNGSVSRQYHMDLVTNQDRFYSRVYLFLDASHVQSLKICDNKTEAVPSGVASYFVKQARCKSSDDVLGIRFVLKGNAALVAPDLPLQKRKSSFVDIEALLQIGQCETFTVYMSSNSISRDRLSALCIALAKGVLKPAPESVIGGLYATANSKIVTHLDDLWALSQPEGPPAYDPSTAHEASDDEPTGQPDFRPLSSLSASRKRQTSSPASRQTPSKRRLLAKKADPKPWELAIAAQAAQIAALCAQVSTLCEEVQRLRCAKVVDAGPNPVPYCVSPSHASTVVNNNEEFVMIVRDNIIDQQEQRALLNAGFDYNDEQIELPHPCTPPLWSPREVNTPIEVSTPTKVIVATRGDSSVETDTSTNLDVSFQAQNSSTHCPSSPHIRPTFLARGTEIERKNALKAQHVREMLEALPNELVLEILSESRVQDLLAIQQGPAQAETLVGSDQIAVTKVEQTVTGHMDTDKYTDDYFNQKVKQAFKSLVHQRLDRLVHDQLPLATELFFRSAVEDLRDQFYEDCKANEAGLRETVDEGCTMLHDETEKCTTEINDLIQDRLDELEHQSNEFRITTGEQLACLGYWSDQFANSTGDKERATKITKRCMSV
ncbi:hypothetical protein KCU91_g12539, partial [Aureobasidium melanogenum]